MQTLVFNTRTKTVQLLDGRREGSNIIEYFENTEYYHNIIYKIDKLKNH